MTNPRRWCLPALLLGVVISCGGRPSHVELDASPGDASPPPRPRRLDVVVLSDTAATGDQVARHGGGIVAMMQDLTSSTTKRVVSDFRFATTTSFVRVNEILAANLCTLFGHVRYSGGDLIPFAQVGNSRFIDSPTLLQTAIVKQVMSSITYSCPVPGYLESTLRALDGRNLGVFREDSLLLVIISAASEDCSTEKGAHWQTSTWPPNVRGHVLCYEPHRPDLLFSVERYVERFKTRHLNGSILFAIVASPDAPEYMTLSDGRRAVRPSCDNQLRPAPRLKAFADKIEALSNPRLGAIFVDGWCAGNLGGGAPYLRIGERVRSMMDLSPTPPSP